MIVEFIKNPIFIGIIFVVAIALFMGYQHYQEWRESDIKIPRPKELRKDLLYGYYGCLDNELDGKPSNQIDETKDHVNLLWEFNYKPLDAIIADIRKAATYTVIDFQSCLFTQVSSGVNIFKETAEADLRVWLDRMRQEDVLKYVKGLVAIDEPNLNTTKEYLLKALAVMRKVVPDYPELNEAKYFCIFSGFKDFFCVDEFDVVGLDKYFRKSSILAKGDLHDKLRSQAKKDARFLLVVGGSYSQDPTPFINYAHSHQDVIMIVCFLWGDAKDGDELIPGIRSLSVKEAYVQAGLSIVNA